MWCLLLCFWLKLLNTVDLQFHPFPCKWQNSVIVTTDYNCGDFHSFIYIIYIQYIYISPFIHPSISRSIESRAGLKRYFWIDQWFLHKICSTRNHWMVSKHKTNSKVEVSLSNLRKVITNTISIWVGVQFLHQNYRASFQFNHKFNWRWFLQVQVISLTFLWRLKVYILSVDGKRR